MSLRIIARQTLRQSIYPRVVPATTSTSLRSLSTLETPYYTASGTSTGGRQAGTAKISDVSNGLEVKLTQPKSMGGAGGEGGDVVNPEQLFSLAYSTCFLSGLRAAYMTLHSSHAKTHPFPSDAQVRSLVSIGKPADGKPGFQLAVELEVVEESLKGLGLGKGELAKVVKKAHELCPYSRAVHGNIEVEVRLA